MPHDMYDVLGHFANAVTDLLAMQALREVDPGERAVVGELHVLLVPRFPDWNVNAEYNRSEADKKRLAAAIPVPGKKDPLIYPDLIIHRINQRYENLLVVEVKKDRTLDAASDIWKLEGMTASNGPYRYAAGVHLLLNIPAGRVEGCDVYIDGSVDQALTAWLRQHFPGGE